MKLKTGDKVEVIAGKDRGKSGKVIQVFSKQGRFQQSKLVVEGLNIIKKHMKSNKRGEKGQILELSAPINASNAVLVCPKCSNKSKIGYKIEGKTKQRVCKKCQEAIDS
ncbi:MAG: 50S ribosomal protein L24 [bacterium]